MEGFHFDISMLFFPISLIFIITLIVSFNISKSPFLSLLVSTIKSALFFIYFNTLDQRYTFVDDDTYILTAQTMYNDGIRFYNFISYAINDWLGFLGYSGGFHFVYQIYNLFSFDLFGPYYFSPVALNIILTLFIGRKLYSYVLTMTENMNFSKFIFIFFLIHWDTLTWSTFLNLKDFIVQYLTINIFLSLFKIFKNISSNKKKSIINIIISSIILLFIRYYIPFFILITVLLFWYLYSYKSKNKWYYFILIFPLFLIFFIKIILPNMQGEITKFQSDMSNPIIGVPRYLLTPFPFSVSGGGEFQTIAAFMHWFLIPFTIYGFIYCIKNKNNLYRILIIYLCALSLFYGMYFELQGPRQRIQIHFIIIFLQGIGIYDFLKSWIKKNKEINAYE